ncbi:MAG: polysaccharide deacetylase family protein [Acidobacteriaceae bacterium]
MSENRGVTCRWLLSAILGFFLIPGAPAPAAALPHTQNHLPHLRRHPTAALTFDDLPAAGGLRPGATRTEILTRLAAELKAAHLRGVYGFVIGADVDDDPDTQDALRVWLASGMNIGNHTWSHPSLTDVTAQAFEHDIALDEPLLRQYAGSRDWHWFRYPYLQEGDTPAKRDSVRDWLHNHGYRIAEVTLTIQDDDWSDPYNRCMAKGDTAGIAWLRQSYMENAAEFLRLGREEEQIAFGHEIPNVLLLHATDFTAVMLPSLLHLLHQQGFRFAPLAKVENNPAYALDPHAGLPNGGPFPNLFMNSRHLKYPPFKPEPVNQLDALCR